MVYVWMEAISRVIFVQAFKLQQFCAWIFKDYQIFHTIGKVSGILIVSKKTKVQRVFKRVP